MDQMSDQQNDYIPAHADAFQYYLPNFTSRLWGSGSIKIVAIGSSSTAGEGDIVPYTYRLEAALRARYSSRMIDVLNRGIGSQEAPDELKRMRDDVIAEAPALVVWQVGTNAVWQKGHNLDDVADAIAQGLTLLGSHSSMDVVMMDLQYAPALLTNDKIDATRRMQSLIQKLAAAGNRVNVFRRFDLMQKFLTLEKHSFDLIIDPTDENRLHQSDFSARRIGYELAAVIADAAARAL
jgi:lysophospholipase L1-like esterase